jgi:hypothetical protein
MQYLLSVIDDGTGPATPTEDADISASNDRLISQAIELAGSIAETA